MFDEKLPNLLANSHMAAIEWMIANTVKLNNNDCDLKS
jgi:hypothetical protein